MHMLYVIEHKRIENSIKEELKDEITRSWGVVER